MTLFFIGLGLYDHKDITLNALDAVKNCDLIFLEDYTSFLHAKKEDLETLYGNKIILADRDLVEKSAEKILEPAKEKNVAFLVPGDVFSATTHIDLVLRARKLNIDIKYFHNSSVLTAVGVVGLELYKYGKITSIVFPEENWSPETAYEVIQNNLRNHLHTLCLLDIKRPENKFMTVNNALKLLLDIEEKRNEKVIDDSTLVIGVARLGYPDQVIKVGPANTLLEEDFGGPLHSLIIPAKKLHFMEEEALKQWS